MKRGRIQKVQKRKDNKIYDKEHFIPGKIFVEQTTKIDNSPETKKLSDMTGIDNISVKDDLLKKWKY